MYRVFNMGIGLVIAVAPQEAEAAIQASAGQALVIGCVTIQEGTERVLLQ